ncbi:uncharacterized protein LOC144107915 isoform X2 [Amblyomma americanum]
MDRRVVTGLSMTAFKALALFSCAVLVASDQEHSHECEERSVRLCYDSYHHYLLAPRAEENPVKSDQEIEKQCREIKNKSSCHQRLARCPEEVRTNFSRQERGYEAIRDLFCDQKTARDYYTSLSCRDGAKLIPCHEKHKEDFASEYATNIGCGLAKAALACYESSFSSNCPLSLQSAKSAHSRSENALLQLYGCDGSAGSHLAPGQLLLTAAALVLLRWTSA